MNRLLGTHLLVCVGLLLGASEPLRAGNEQTVRFDTTWTVSGNTPARVIHEISGTNARNNPLRRRLEKPFSGEELFVRFRLRYVAETLDTPQTDEGEFLVLWLDEAEGNDRSTHNGATPNLGLHVADGENRFMVRYSSSRQKFSDVTVEGDRQYLLVGRLWKSRPGPDEPFDSLDLWIDPAPHEELKPDASATSRQSIAAVHWVGFSTGRKTEPTDRIQISGLELSTTWESALGLPPKLEPTSAEPETPLTAEPTVDFAADIHPILRKRCFGCHSGESPPAGIRLDVYDELLNHVTPRNASASRLLQLVRSDDPDQRMPPVGEGEPVPANELALLRTWIDEGVAWDEELLPTPVPQSDHWAFQPIERPPVPDTGDSQRVNNPVDAFIARKQSQLGTQPAPPAPRAALVRRLWLDLVGLPPGSVELPELTGAATESSEPREEIDRLIERLLASPHHGERWGRHWLDVVRWAESNGHQHNRNRPHAWRYRDYVVRSINENKPFDEFLREQIAGDELPFEREHLVATGFLAAARYSGNELDKSIQRNDILVDVANTTAQAFLGLTLGCAQCHSHKFDPISIRDYYRFQAFFGRGQPGNIVLQADDETTSRLVEMRWRIFEGVRARLKRQKRKRGVPEPILITASSVRRGMSRRERELFDRMERQIDELPQTWGWYAPASASTELPVAPHTMRWPLPHDQRAFANRRTYLLIRGDVNNPGPRVEPGWPAVFGPTPPIDGRPRTALADWMVSRDNPLTARVWVNRLWQWHFGRGLVKSSGDFGTQGEPPTHPELLDWLAAELIESGWNTRHIHRLILQSHTYRQSTAFSEKNHDRDPANASYWRRRPRRLEAEVIRDMALALAGRLDLTVGGPSVALKSPDASHRRSLYLQQKRDNLPHQQMLFDGPNAVTSCARRRVSTVPLQSLYLLNSDFMQQMSRQFAERVRRAAAGTDEQIDTAMRIALARQPDAEQCAQARQFLEQGTLEEFCLVLLNLNEFVYTP